MSLSLWQQCLARLQDELPATEFSMWIRPLQAELSDNTLALYAPNRFVLDWVGINTSIISMDSSMIFAVLMPHNCDLKSGLARRCRRNAAR